MVPPMGLMCYSMGRPCVAHVLPIALECYADPWVVQGPMDPPWWYSACPWIIHGFIVLAHGCPMGRQIMGLQLVGRAARMPPPWVHSTHPWVSQGCSGDPWSTHGYLVLAHESTI